MQPRMVQQIIKYSDGTETIINYQDSNIMEEEIKVEAEVVEESAPEATVEETVETPVAEKAAAEPIEETA